MSTGTNDDAVEAVAAEMFNYDARPDGETWDKDADDETQALYRERARSVIAVMRDATDEYEAVAGWRIGRQADSEAHRESGYCYVARCGFVFRRPVSSEDVPR